LSEATRSLIGKSMPIIDLTDNELAALVAGVKRLIREDRIPHAPRLDPLRSVLAQLEAIAAPPRPQTAKSGKAAAQEPKPPKGRPRGS
jgi:hypothetical protein